MGPSLFPCQQAGYRKVKRMLYLTRKVGESVLINDDIEVTVVEVRGRSVKLGFTFPTGASVLRRELYEKIQRENEEAARADPTLLGEAAGEPTAVADPGC